MTRLWFNVARNILFNRINGYHFSEIYVGNQISNQNATLTYQRVFNPDLSQLRSIDIPPRGTPSVGDKQNLIYKFELNGFIYEADVSMIYYKDPETGATY